MAETADLKSLARRVIERDRARDTGRDRPGSDCLAAELASRRPLETAPLPRSLNEQDYDTAIPEFYAVRWVPVMTNRCLRYIVTAPVGCSMAAVAAGGASRPRPLVGRRGTCSACRISRRSRRGIIGGSPGTTKPG
jgi:hypothetical protein